MIVTPALLILMQRATDDQLIAVLAADRLDGAEARDSAGFPLAWGDGLLWAVRYRRCAVIRWMAAQGFDLNTLGTRHHTALNAATDTDNLPLVRLLLELGARPNDADILQAARRDAAALHLMIKHGADPNARGHAGRTPLMQAVIAGRLENAWLLLDRGADPGLRTDYGFSALDFARKRGADEIAALLEAWQTP